MAKTSAKPIVLGFMTVRETDRGGLRGGYLLTTDYGRPIEFHYTTEFNMGQHQRILYGSSYEPFVYGEVLGKPMTDRQGTAPQIIVVDVPALLHLRPLIPAPVLLLQPASASDASSESTDQALAWTSLSHRQFEKDLSAFEQIRPLAAANLDWLEPFERLGQAMAEIHDPQVDRAA